MRARIIITDDRGDTLEGEVALSRATGSRRIAGGVSPAKPKISPSLDFDLPVRAFVKAHVQRLSGSKKFALLTAHLAKGREGQEIRLKDVARQWNRMTSLMGGKFNRKFSAVAREDGWVDTKKAGVYFLRSSWRQIFHQRGGRAKS